VTITIRKQIVDEVRKIDDLATAALTAELICYPKPGLVSLRDSGSHADMDAATFIISIASLRGYFEDMANAGSKAATFKTLNEIGLTAERKMLEATGGVNTHRGAVFSLGLLAASAGYSIAYDRPKTAEWVCQQVGSLWGDDILATQHQCYGTNGATARARFGVQGARQHAASGFPVVRNHAMPALRQGLEAGLDANWSGVHSFLTCIAILDDTNLLHRGGEEALSFARQRAQSVLQAGGALTAAGREQACLLHTDFVAAWLSPGGSADMLALCYFLHGLEDAFGA
jgi:triphosphoribosyl-dephospho-CoA synthase